MEYSFKYALSDEEKVSFENFYSSLSLVSIEQHYNWPFVECASVRYCYFSAAQNGKYGCTAIVIENYSNVFPIASIRFGPLFSDNNILIESIIAISEYYKEKKFIELNIQLAISTGSDADFIEYNLYKKIKFKSFFNKENWSSIVLDLQLDEENIFRKFSKGHKSDIKKALRSNISIVDLQNPQDFKDLCSVFVKMNQSRGLQINNDQFINHLEKVRNEYILKGKGKVLIAKTSDGSLIGGIILLFQNNTVRFYKGASDPDFRSLPILHLALWEGIRQSKALGFNVFDFWGYNHFVNEDEQIFFINRFKKGFGGNYIFYPKKIYIIYNPLKSKLYRFLKRSNLFNKK